MGDPCCGTEGSLLKNIIEIYVRTLNTLTMTVTADAKQRVILPQARPGDTFDVQLAGEGKLILTRLESGAFNPAQVRIEKRGTFSVGVLDHPINDEALKAALADFP